MKILIVDDEEINLRLLNRLVSPYGEVTTAIDGAQAVAAFHEELESGEPFKLIIMDIMMPIMDGIIAMKKIRVLEKKHQITSARSAFIIMATAVETGSTQIEAKRGDYGCNAYLLKPITKRKLHAVLKEHHLVGMDDS